MTWTSIVISLEYGPELSDPPTRAGRLLRSPVTSHLLCYLSCQYFIEIWMIYLCLLFLPQNSFTVLAIMFSAIILDRIQRWNFHICAYMYTLLSLVHYH